MPSHTKLKIKPVQDDVPVDDDPFQDTNEKESGRPARRAKTKAVAAQPWIGAAPTGRQPKASGADPGTRKRAASTSKQSAKNKTSKKNHPGGVINVSPAEDNPMEDIDDVPPPLPTRKQAPRARPGVIYSEDEDDTDYRILQRPRAKPKRVPAPEPQEAEDVVFADEAENDAEDEAQDGEDDDDPVFEEEDDLEGAHEKVVAQKLADAKPQWADDNSDLELERLPELEQRSLSRASVSSGHMSVPESEYLQDGTEDLDDEQEEESDYDPKLAAALGGLGKAHMHAPQPRKSVKTALAAGGPSATQAMDSRPPPPRLDLVAMANRGRLQEKRRVTEVPTWNTERSSSRAPLTAARDEGHPSSQAARRLTERSSSHASRPPRARTDDPSSLENAQDARRSSHAPRRIAERSSSRPSRTAVDPDSIDLVYNDSNRLNLKQQHHLVEATVQTGINYFFVSLITEDFFPSTMDRTAFAHKALKDAAKFLDIKTVANRLQHDQMYCEALAKLLYARVSTFRGAAKKTAAAALFSYYKVQAECGERVAELLHGQTFIYAQKADSIDPETKALKFGKPIYAQPFEHPAVAHVIGHYFRGTSSIIGRISEVLPRSGAGNLVMPRPLLAMCCAAIFSALSDFSSGNLMNSDFEGRTVQDAYETYLTILTTLCKRKPSQYDSLMEKLFNDASRGTNVNVGDVVPPLQQAALALLDLDD